MLFGLLSGRGISQKLSHLKVNLAFKGGDFWGRCGSLAFFFFLGKQYTLVGYATLFPFSLSLSLSLSLWYMYVRMSERGMDDHFLVELHENILSLSGVYASGSFHVTHKIIANGLLPK